MKFKFPVSLGSRNMLSAALTAWFIVAAVGLAASQQTSDVYLVGAYLYVATSNGADSISNSDYNGDYRYSTNSSTPLSFRLDIASQLSSQDNQISFDLNQGDNDLTFAGVNSTPFGSYAGLGLFFNSTGESYNPSDSTPTAGDLTVYGPTDGSDSFFVPVVGSEIRSYAGEYDPVTAPYSGATVLQVGSEDVSVAAYSVDGYPEGSLTISVTQASEFTPEPSSLVLAVAGAVATALIMRMRKWARK